MFIAATLKTARETARQAAHTHAVHLHLTACHMLDPDAAYIELIVHPNNPTDPLHGLAIELTPGNAADLSIAIGQAITDLRPPKPYRHPAEGGDLDRRPAASP